MRFLFRGLLGFSVVLLLTLGGLLASCRSHQELVYFGDAERDSAQVILKDYTNAIHTGDQLYIYVYSQTPEAAVPFNQETHLMTVEMSRANGTGSRHVTRVAESYYQNHRYRTLGYLVDEEGGIRFPVIGKIVAAGLTLDSLSRKIECLLAEGGYINDAVVTVSPMNFRVSVVGEVRRPQEIHVTGERLTLLEALAKCGDVTGDGVRESVVVVRERDGVAVPIEVDLTKKTLFDSEAYYLQHNDIVYVEPTGKKKRRATYDPNLRHDVLSYVRLGGAVARLTYVMAYRRYRLERRGLFH